MNEPRQVPLHSTHLALNAKMIPFAGFEMPVSYGSLTQEHLTVRKAVGLFDVSHMGEFMVSGENALDFLQWVTTNDVSALFDGKVQYSCLTNTLGGIIDDLLVYRIHQNKYFLVVNASNIAKDWAWLNEQNTFGVTLENHSDDLCLLALQGPKAIATLSKITELPLETMPYYTFLTGEVAGVPNVTVSTTGYTGAGGFELYMPNSQASIIWEALMSAGAEFGILPAGLGCRDTLRTEMGFCLYGNDIDDSTSPIEAGLGWVTKFNKKFVYGDFHQQLKTNGVVRKLVGFEMIDRGIPRQHYEIMDASGQIVGEVTSGTQSPSLNKGIGMGYVQTEFSKIGTDIYVHIRGKYLKACVVKTPFL